MGRNSGSWEERDSANPSQTNEANDERARWITMNSPSFTESLHWRIARIVGAIGKYIVASWRKSSQVAEEE